MRRRLLTIALYALAVLLLVPVMWRRWRENGNDVDALACLCVLAAGPLLIVGLVA